MIVVSSGQLSGTPNRPVMMMSGQVLAYTY